MIALKRKRQAAAMVLVAFVVWVGYVSHRATRRVDAARILEGVGAVYTRQTILNGMRGMEYLTCPPAKPKSSFSVSSIVSAIDYRIAGWNKIGMSFNDDITDETISLILQFPELRSLDLSGSAIRDDQLKKLGALSNLTTLNISHTAITDEGVAALEGLGHLASLNMNSTELSDQGAQVLANFPHLRWLEMEDTHVSNGSMDVLVSLDQLECLRLQGTMVTDSAVPRLASLKKLRTLGHPSIKKSTADYLRLNLPHCDLAGTYRRE